MDRVMTTNVPKKTTSKYQIRLWSVLITLLTGMPGATASAADGATSSWVYPGPDGKLVYKTTPAGDKIMDFSHAGYMGGGVAIPDVPVKITVKPEGREDDT